MTTLREAAQQALKALTWSPSSMTEECEAAAAALRAALAGGDNLSPTEPVQEPFFTEANGFPQTFVPKDRQKQAIISLTDQCAALIQERDELQKQVWLYEKNGVTCQTYRHTVEQSCAECNVQMSYTSPRQRTSEPVQEPVQEPVHEHEKWCASVTQLLLCDPPRKAPCNCKPTAPPQRKPLSEEEISAIDWKAGETLHDFARAIERAHGIGGSDE